MRFVAAAAALAGLAAAIPTGSHSLSAHSFLSAPDAVSRRDGGPKKAADLIREIAPGSGDCSKAPFKDECITAQDAAPLLINAMFAYKVYTPSAIAAIIALIALESGELQYNRNHYPEPGNPGQGTRNMQGINFNLQYARSKPELAAKLPAGDAGSLSDDQKNQVLDLVLPNQYSFETAPWFLTTVCKPDVLDQFKTDPDAAWMAYMACVGVPGDSPDRIAYWNTAKTAFGIA